MLSSYWKCGSGLDPDPHWWCSPRIKNADPDQIQELGYWPNLTKRLLHQLRYVSIHTTYIQYIFHVKIRFSRRQSPTRIWIRIRIGLATWIQICIRTEVKSLVLIRICVEPMQNSKDCPPQWFSPGFRIFFSDNEKTTQQTHKNYPLYQTLQPSVHVHRHTVQPNSSSRCFKSTSSTRRRRRLRAQRGRRYRLLQQPALRLEKELPSTNSCIFPIIVQQCTFLPQK
jgi:hypothetical protein